MTLYVLDTDTLSLYERDDPIVAPRVDAHLDAQPASQVAITVISVEEQLSGWYGLIRRVKSSAELALAYDQLARTVTFLGHLPILSLTEAVIARHKQLQAMKLNVGKQDLRIAAIALEHNAVVVTRNTRDFGRIPNLVTEDWST